MSEPRTVRPAPGVDFRSLPLTPSQGYVLSRITQPTTEAEIAVATGLPPHSVTDAVDRLIELQAVLVGSDDEVARAKAKQVVASMALGGLSRASDVVRYQPEELAEEAELDVEKKKLILNTFYALRELNLYELLGVHELSDKKEIKAAYYQVAPDFHPDKYFRRNLGSFKAKIEAIFTKLTEAHDTLTMKRRRAEYDEYLATVHTNRKAADLLGATEQAIARARAEIDASAQTAVGNTSGQPAPTPAGPSAQDKAAALRRQTFARKLRGLKPPPGAPTTPPPSQRAAVDPRQAAEALRARYEAAKRQAETSQKEKYVRVGREALAQRDYAAAANAFRIAASVAPDDPALQAEAAQVVREAAAELADGFMRQADLEARQERWEEAAMSYSKVCHGRPDDPKAHDRAAYAMFKAGSNPRRAVELARRAVELAPKQPGYRITLAYTYFDSNLVTSAQAELDRALELAPGEPKVQSLVDQAKEYFASPPGRRPTTGLAESIKPGP